MERANRPPYQAERRRKSPEEWEAERQAKMDEAVERLAEGVEKIQSEDGFKDYLKAQSRFHRYSPNNILLIQAQRPDATRVASYDTWKKLGRQVNRGEQGIQIFVPRFGKTTKVDEETGEETEASKLVGFGIGKVFNIDQTTGDPLPMPPVAKRLEQSTQPGKELYGALTDWLTNEGVTIGRAEIPANGMYAPVDKAITLHRGLVGDQNTKTLAHEAGHHVALKRGYMIDRADEETIAESTAFVVLNHYGVDAQDYSMPYVAGWAENPETFKRNLESIQKGAREIIDGVEATAEARTIYQV